MTKYSSPLLAPIKGYSVKFVLTTIPLLVVLVYFLYEAWQRPKQPIYNLPEGYTEYQYEEARQESGIFISLLDILTVFLSLHVFWTSFGVHILSFVAKRRHLMGRYMAEGEISFGDIIYDKNSRLCGGFNDYGYAVYAHPIQRKLIRKRVRVYQPYTRERVEILRLPNRPLSGQPKVDLEIGLNTAAKERDSSNRHVERWAIFWVVFTMVGSLFVLYQMSLIQDERDDISLGIKLFLVVIGLNVPIAFATNWIRFLLYRNWMINRGAIVDDNGDARNVQGCLKAAESEDGTDVIPYSILNEEEMSYQGSIPSHSGSLPSNQTVPDGSAEVLPKSGPQHGETEKKTWVTI